MTNVSQMIDDILRREGGYVDHAADRGGPTKYGITQKALTGWRERPVTADDVRAMTEEEARNIYRAFYFERPKLNRLPETIQAQMFDITVNSGPKQAVRLLQRALNATSFGPLIEDGLLGSQTINAARHAVRILGDELNNVLVEERRDFYHAIVAFNPSQKVFLKGWLKRAEEFRSAPC